MRPAACEVRDGGVCDRRAVVKRSWVGRGFVLEGGGVGKRDREEFVLGRMVVASDGLIRESEETPLLTGNGEDGAGYVEWDPLLHGATAERPSGEWPMKVLILMSDTGGGHRASAEALTAAMKHLYKDNVSVSMVDLWVEIAGWPFSTYPWWYRFVAKYPPLWLVVYWYAKFPPTRWFQEQMWQVLCHNKVKRYIASHEPDVIVSVHPMVNRLTQNVLRRTRAFDRQTTPIFVTVVTDYGDAHPMWFHKDSEATYIPSEPVRKLALAAGLSNSTLRVYGLALREPFWNDKTDKFGTRRQLELPMDKPIALLMGGGDGMGNIEEIATSVASQIAEKLGKDGAELVVICGRNKKILDRMAAREWPISVRCEGFVKNVDQFMEASDVLITKAGPGSIAEAFVKGLPIIVFSYLPGQETGNMRFVVDNDLGVYSPNPEEIGRVAAEWVADPEHLAEMRSRAKRVAMPSASVDIARDIGVVYQTTAPILSSRLGLESEIREEWRETIVRSVAIFIAFVLMLVIIYLLIHLLT